MPSRTGRLGACLALLLVCLAAAGAAFANDLRIELFDATLKQNGIAVGGNEVGYFTAADTLSVDVELATSWQCDVIVIGSPIGIRVCADPPSFDYRIEVATCPPGLCVNQQTFTVATGRLDGATEVRDRPPGTVNPPPLNLTASRQLQIDLSDLPGFNAFAAGAYNSGRVMLIRAFIDTSFEVDEDSEFNFLANALAEPIPLDGALSFGPTPTTLTGFTTLQANATCGARSGQSADLTNLFIFGTAAWAPAPSPDWPPVDVTLAPICATFALNAAQDALALTFTPVGNASDVMAGTVLGQLNGFPVQVTGNVLDENGATPGPIDVKLPARHSAHPDGHPDDPGLPGPSPRGSMFLRLATITQSDPTDYTQIQASGGGQWLHAEGLPFSVQIGTVALGSASLVGDYTRVHYLHDRRYSTSFLISDPRRLNGQGPRSNDRRFSFPLPAQASTQAFAVTPDGMIIPSLVFGEVGGSLNHFPRSKTFGIPRFEVAVAGGRLVAGEVPAAGRYTMALGTDCAGCDSGANDAVYSVAPILGDGLGSDGAVVSKVEGLRDPEWGPYLISIDATIDTSAPDLIISLGDALSYDLDNGFSALFPVTDRKHIYERSGDAGKPGVMLLPGGVAAGTGGTDGTRVADYLLGSRAVTATASHLRPATHHLLSSGTAQRGNHFMAGLTVGPELYSRVDNKQPQVGEGADLSDTQMTIGFGGKSDPDFETLGSAIGTKYVVRPGGVTGAFNFDTIPTPEIYGGYVLNLERFAFRQINNVPDEYSWIDGRLDIPGKGDFRVVFESMELECSGDFGGGLVVREQCDGIDNNNRFDVDENCFEQFTAWNAPVDFLSMAFVPDDPALPICEVQGRDLEIGNTVAVAALNEPLAMIARWTPDGDPFQAKLSGKTDHVLDQPKDAGGDPIADQPGFNVALASGISLKTPGGANEDGWFEATADMGLPFWQALDAKLRLANKAGTPATEPPVQIQTIVIEEGESLTGNDDNHPNPALVDEMRTAGSYDPAAAYQWGSTGFEFAAPIYFEPGRHTDGLHPQFLGRTFNKDLVVLELNAGVDYVTPAATRVSFGASADFDKLVEIDFDFNIDANDPNALQKIDDFICGDLPFPVDCDPTGPVVSLLGPVRDKLSLLNLVSDSGLDGFMEQGVRAALSFPSGSDPFALAATRIGKLQSIPQQLASAVDDGLKDLTADLVGPLSNTLDMAMIEVYENLPQLYLDAAPPTAAPDQAELDKYIALLAHAIVQIGEVRKVLDQDMSGQLNQITQSIEALNGETAQLVTQATSALTGLNGLVNQLQGAGGLNVCDLVADPDGSAPASKLLGQLFEVVRRMDDLRDVLDQVEAGNQLVGFALGIASAAGVDLDGVSSAQQSVGVLVEEASLLVDNAFGHLSGICAGAVLAEVQQILDGALGRLTQVSSQLATATAKMQNVRDELLDPDPVTGKLTAVKARILEAAAALDLIEDFLADQVEIATAAKAGFPEGFAYEGLLANEIQQQVFQSVLGTYAMVYDLGGASERSFVRELADSLRTPIDQAIADAAAVGFSQLQDVVDVLPQPSAGELRTLVTDLIMNSPAVESIDHATYMAIDQVGSQLNDIALDLFDPVAFVVQELVAQIEGLANEALDAATSSLKSNLPVGAARLDGYALIEGDELMRLHVGAEWTMSGDAEESTSKYGAALDIVSWNANNKAMNCLGTDADGILDASISIFGVPIEFGPVDVVLQELTLGFTIEQLAPVGFFGLIILDGEINFQTFVIYDVGFAVGVGKYENYLGAAAGAQFDGIAMSVAFLIGKTCNTEVLTKLDPQAAEWVTFPGGIFNGVYVRGSASVPIWEAGCFLRVGVGASAGAWVLIGPPLTIGGVVSGAAYGKALCLAALRGQITVWGEKSGDQFNFGGDGFGAVGIGFDCDEATWTSIPKVRADDWCGTGDASFKAVYRNGWNLGPMDTSAID